MQIQNRRYSITVAIFMSLSILCISNLSQAARVVSPEAEVTIEVRAMNWSYDPPEITVQEGDHVILRLTSLDGHHEFVIDEYGIHVDVERGEWTVVEFVADTEGDFYYYCAVSAHRGYGEQGVLHVLVGGKTPTTLTVKFTQIKGAVGENVEVTGSVDPAIEGITVRLIYTSPAGLEILNEVTTSSGGKFTDTFTPNAEGRWTVVANWLGDEEHLGAESDPAYLVVQQPFPILWVGAGIGAVVVVGIVYYIIKKRA